MRRKRNPWFFPLAVLMTGIGSAAAVKYFGFPSVAAAAASPSMKEAVIERLEMQSPVANAEANVVEIVSEEDKQPVQEEELQFHDDVPEEKENEEEDEDEEAELHDVPEEEEEDVLEAPPQLLAPPLTRSRARQQHQPTMLARVLSRAHDVQERWSTRLRPKQKKQ